MKITDDMLTGWFPSSVKPVRDGIYLTRFDGIGIPGYRVWKHDKWLYIEDQTQICVFQDPEWRGLKKEPKRD